MTDALRVSVMLRGKELKSRTFAKDRIVIGRDADCDLRLNSPEVSRHHLCIQRRDNCGYLLVDAESANGTFVGEERVSLVPIRTGARARVGRYEIAFELLDVPWSPSEELETPRPEVGATLRGDELDQPGPDTARNPAETNLRGRKSWLSQFVARILG